MKVVIVREIEEMPEDCDSCPFQDFDRNCGILGEYSMLNEWVTDAPYYDLKGKGDCPLKPLPEPKDIVYPNEDYDVGFGDGWDACLKELQK